MRRNNSKHNHIRLSSKRINSSNAERELDHETKRQNKSVLKSKGRVGFGRFVIVVMFVVIATVIYLLLEQQEETNFQTALEQFRLTLTDAAVKRQRDIHNGFADMATTISYMVEIAESEGNHTTSNRTTPWPFVTVTKFETLAQAFKRTSLAEYVTLNYVVYNADQVAYVDFVTDHYQDWTKEGHMIAHNHLNNLNNDTSLYNEMITSRNAAGAFKQDKDDRPRYYVRTVQSPPAREYGPLLNWNIRTTPQSDVIDSLISNTPNETMYSFVKEFKVLSVSEHRGFHTGDSLDHPHTFGYHLIPNIPNNYNSKIVAILSGAVAWDASMMKLLPDTVNGLHAVIHNTCDQSYTYLLNGPQATYLGEGDLHGKKFDYLNMEDNRLTTSLTVASHKDFELSAGHCMYSMSIYPTDTFQDEYKTGTPKRFTILVVTTFALFSIIFSVYDYVIEKRNQKLAISAAKFDAVVSSMFPSEFRQQILDQQDNTVIRTTKTSKILSSIGIHRRQESLDENYDGNSLNISRVYPKTTILFADLVGFTKWSSKREPVETFTLLETVFNAFDAIAERYGVFKVETVGDCYVAVTGLPYAQVDHDVRMARFAMECLHQIHGLTVKLAEKLGDDTLGLNIRVGMHSGSVTGGVLRGKKSRFQLFGDTMNTAALMESNGSPGKIQVSASTATLLRKHKKSGWLQAREEKIIAKGKGAMQTYWLSAPQERLAFFRLSSEKI